MSDENITPEGGFEPDDLNAVSPTPEPPPETHHDDPKVGESPEDHIEQDAHEAENAKKPGLLSQGSLGGAKKKMHHDSAKERLAQDEDDIKHGKTRGVNEEYGKHGTQAEVLAGSEKFAGDSEKAAELAAIIAASIVTAGGAGAAAAGAEGAAAAGTAATGTAAAEGAAVAGTAAATEGAAATTAAGATAAETAAAESAAAATRAGASAASSSSAEAAAGAGARTAASEGAASSQGARAASEASKGAAKSSGAASEQAVANTAKTTGEKAASDSAAKAARVGEAPGQTISTDAAARRAGTQSAEESAKKVTSDSVGQRKKIVEEAKKKAKSEGKKQAKKHARELADGTKTSRHKAKRDRKNSRYDQQVMAEQNLAARNSAKSGGNSAAAGAAVAGGAAGAGAAAGNATSATGATGPSMTGTAGDKTVAVTSDSRWEKKQGRQANEQAQSGKLAQNRAAKGQKNKKLSDKDARKDLLKQEAATRNKDQSGPDHRGRYEKKMDKKQEKTGHNSANKPIVGGIARGRMAMDRKIKSMWTAAATAVGVSLFMVLTMVTVTTTTTTGSNQAAQNNQQNAISGAFVGMSVCTPEGTSGGGGSEGPGDTGPIDPTKESHAKAVYKIFSGMGMPDKNIAGILGNWDQESAVDPTGVQGVFDEPYEIGPKKKAILDRSGSNYGIGLGQWTADRNTMLKNYAKEKNKDWYDINIQLKFMTDPQGDNPSDVAIIQGMIDEEQSSPSAAAIFFETKWERAGKPNVAARTAAAEKWYKEMDSWEKGSGGGDDSEAEEPAEEPDEDSGEDSGGEDTDSGEKTTGEAPHWTMPMKDSDYSTSSGYGPRPSPTPGASSWHKGADFAGADGKPIFAAGDGKVVKAGASSGFGNWVVIDHKYDGKTYSSVYGHMRGNTIKVKEGDTVNAGQEIAAVGSEGFSTGPHLHFEIWDGGRFGGNHTNPVKFLNEVGATDDATGAEGPDGPGNGGGGEDGGSTGDCSNGLLSWLFGGGGGGNNGGGDDAGKGDEDGDTAPGVTDLQNKSIEAGKSQLGIPYSWGGGGLDGPTRGFGRGANTVGFDCSSFVRYAYYQGSGGKIEMPRTASLQQKWSGMKDIKRADLQPGDLIFMGASAHHVAMYVGNGKILHAPQTGDVIKIAQFDGSSYYESQDLTFRRVTN